ncbi:MAG: hypothetical protein U1F65_06235 [Verrucomicrobiota bacterium]
MNKHLFLTFATAVSLVAQNLFAAEKATVTGVATSLEAWKANEGDVVFYGKVVDQFTNPVVAADVEVDVPEQTGFMQRAARKKMVVTDSNGEFEVSAKTYGLRNLNGSFLLIEKISKDGYEFVRANSTNSFTYQKGYTDFHIADKTKPEVFSMRKKTLAPAFLFQETDLKLGSGIAASAWTNGYDFIKGHRFNDTHRLIFNDEPVFPDIQCKATFNTNYATWTVTLMPGNTNGGIIASEQMLYEAPETGYQPEYVFTPEDRPQQVKMAHLYLKSREPAIYTRIDIRYLNAGPEFFRLSGESVTNPYGERNLERATDLPWAVTKQLTDEVETAFRENKRPAPPDLPKLIQGAKAQSGEK